MSDAARWIIERDEDGQPVRMRWSERPVPAPDPRHLGVYTELVPGWPRPAVYEIAGRLSEPPKGGQDERD